MLEMTIFDRFSFSSSTSFDSSIVERKAILPVTPKQVKKSSVSPKEKKNFEDLFAEGLFMLVSHIFSFYSAIYV